MGANPLAIQKALKVASNPTAVLGHGSEGLFSSPGLGEETTKPGKSPGASIKNPEVYEALLKRGYSKERAAAISNAMVGHKNPDKKTTKGIENAPNYHFSESPTNRCDDCFFYNNKSCCTLFNFLAHPAYTCDDYRSDENELSERQLVIQAALEKLHGKRVTPYIAALRADLTPEQARVVSNSMIIAGKATKTGITVFKDKNGRYRWVGLSSNAFRDRDGEIVSTKSLAQDVARADKDGDYGPLRFWHTPINLGTTDFNMLHGRTLIESGILDDDVAELIAEKAGDYQLSIGFMHPSSEPDGNGVFNNIRRFERSLVPAGLAANPFTKFSTIKEKSSMNDQAKILALKALLGDELGTQKLQDAEQSEKAADGMGVAFKSKDEAGAYVREVILAGLALKEAELELLADEEPETTETEKGYPYPEVEQKMGGMKPGPANEYMEKMDGYMTEMKMAVNKMSEFMGGMDGMVQKMGHKEVTPNPVIDDLSSRFKAIEDQLASILTEQPAVVSGVRPSQSQANTIEGVEGFTQKALANQPEQPNALEDFFNFVMPSPNGGG
jgi:hypothetical protein